jgi:long-chain acyl-CoA synthetase
MSSVIGAAICSDPNIRSCELEEQERLVEIDGHCTIPSLFWAKTIERGDDTALREKDFGIWRAYSWRQYGEFAKSVGLGLVSLGLMRGDVVSIISENISEWYFTDMGVLGAGGVSNGIYTTDSARQVEHIVNDSRTRFLLVENEEQLDKMLESRSRCPTLAKIIVFDMKGLRRLRDSQVMSFEDLLEAGRRYDCAHPGFWEQEVAKARPGDLAILIYTSGTTGAPKGAMISHRNVLFQVGNSHVFCEMSKKDVLLSFLPLCHIAERKFSVFYQLRTGAIVNLVERSDTVFDNIREVSPTFLFAVPRIWEKIYSDIVFRMGEATRLGALAYQLALVIGNKVADRRLSNRSIPLLLMAAFRIADRAVLRNIKLWMGLSRIRVIGTGAAPIAPDLIRWYLSLGLEMREIYGQTECCGIATVMPPAVKLGTVGKAEPGTDIRTSDEGEILIRGPHVFLGYLNNPKKTSETVVDGWLRTGDVGIVDKDGYLKITDRMKDIIITAGGKNITPSEIENQLKFSPYISDAVVIGDKRKFLSCLVMIDHDNVATFAQSRKIPFTNYASLCAATEVQALIAAEVEKVNLTLARVETIKKFRLIDQLLTAEDDELTPTMKLKRNFVNEKYKSLIESMYR